MTNTTEHEGIINKNSGQTMASVFRDLANDICGDTDTDTDSTIPSWSKRHPEYQEFYNKRKAETDVANDRFFCLVQLREARDKDYAKFIGEYFSFNFQTLAIPDIQKGFFEEAVNTYDSEEEQEQTRQACRAFIEDISFFLCEVHENGYVNLDNDVWSVLITDSEYDYKSQDIVDIIKESESIDRTIHNLVNSGSCISVDGLPISLLETNNIKAICSLKGAYLNKYDIKSLISDVKQTVDILGGQEQAAYNWFKQTIQDNLLDDFFKSRQIDKLLYSDIEAMVKNETLIFINDAHRKIGGLGGYRGINTYQIGQPPLELFGRTDIYKNDYSFTNFDELDVEGITVLGDYIVFSGHYEVEVKSRESKERTKRVYIAQNTKEISDHIFKYKSKEHINEKVSVYAGGSLLHKDLMMCDYCTHENAVPTDQYGFTCSKCGQENS